MNDSMKNADNILADIVEMYCTNGRSAGLVPKSHAVQAVNNGWAYVLTTSDCVYYKGEQK